MEILLNIKNETSRFKIDDNTRHFSFTVGGDYSIFQILSDFKKDNPQLTNITSRVDHRGIYDEISIRFELKNEEEPLQMIFVGQQTPTPKITTFIVPVPTDLLNKISNQIKKKYGKEADFEIGKIEVRLFEK